MVGFGDGERERFRARMVRPARPAEDAAEAERVAEAREEVRRSRDNGVDPDPGSHASPRAPYPDPFTDPEPLRALEDRILEIAAHVELAVHQQLQLLAEFDARRGWEL
ncbi:MAG: hypothetical protein EA350_00010, partial [Gemmatimonadales bacterium]